MFPMSVNLDDNMNPIRYARSLDQLSQAKLARKLQISRPFLIRVEQGCYKTPGSDLTNYAAQTLTVTPRRITETYINFQTARRYSTLDSLTGLSGLVGPVAAPSNITKNSSEGVATVNLRRIFVHEQFKEWREGYWSSAIDFAVSFCVHPDSVRKYELGQMLRMPEQLQDVLRQCNLIGNIDVDRRWYYAY